MTQSRVTILFEQIRQRQLQEVTWLIQGHNIKGNLTPKVTTEMETQQKTKLSIKTDLGSLNSTNIVAENQRHDFLLREGNSASFLGLTAWPRKLPTSALRSKGRLDMAEQEPTREKPRKEDPKESLWCYLRPCSLALCLECFAASSFPSVYNSAQVSNM